MGSKVRNLRTWWILLALAVVLACGKNVAEEAGESTDAKEEDSKERDSRVVEKEKKKKRLVYTYDPIGKRDPFRRYVPRGLDQAVSLSPLEQFDVDQLKVIGVVWGISSPRAMVIAPDGKGYVVGKGVSVGKGRGKVSRITQEGVVVAEEYRDFEGNLLVSETVLTVRTATEK